MEIIALLQKYGAKVKGAGGQLVEYQIFNVKSLEEAVTREWEIDPADIKLGEKIGEGECAPRPPPRTRSAALQPVTELGVLPTWQPAARASSFPTKPLGHLRSRVDASRRASHGGSPQVGMRVWF